MQIVTQPDLIEQSDFSAGWATSVDVDLPSMDPALLRDVSNLLPETTTGALRTRKGFRRVLDVLTVSGFTLKQVFAFQAHYSNATHHFILCIFNDGGSGSNNVRIYALDLGTGSATRIDTAGRTWNNPTENHWGLAIQGVWYGGVRGEKMYSWNPSTSTWDADASTKASWKTWTANTGGAVNTATEYGKDYAFDGTEKVKKGAKYYIPAKDIRYSNWDSGDQYRKGQRVSRKGTYGGSTYYTSWKCVQDHLADAVNRPGDGTGSWQPFWDKVRLSSPENDDGDTSNDWDFLPLAAKTSVGTWHGNRLWLRYDDSGDKSRLQFSAPMKTKHGQDIAALEFEPTDFAPGTDASGNGGGWFNVNDGKHHGIISALRSYGQYLMIWKRQAAWVMTGLSEESFNLRKLSAGTGCIGPYAHIEHNGLVYFLDDEGLYVTDGTSVEPAPGLDNVREWLKDRISKMLVLADNRPAYLESYDGYIFISLPVTGDSEENVTLIYHPGFESFWYTTLPILSMTKTHIEKVARLYFAGTTAHSTRGIVYEYDHASAADQDDDGGSSYGGVDIPWQMTSAFWAFGTAREQRRIRRTWAIARANQNVTLTQYRDWNTASVNSVARPLTSTALAAYVEGQVMQDSHSISLKVSGTKAPAGVYGLAVDTEPRRKRYHTG